MSDLLTELRDPHNVLSEPYKSLGDLCREAATEIENLRIELRLALRQWKMYSESIEANDGFDLATEKSAEGDLYRGAYALAHKDRS